MKRADFRRRDRDAGYRGTNDVAGGGPGLGGSGRQSTADESAYMRSRLRTRYFTARFPDVPLPPQGSRNPASLIAAARNYHEDGDAERASELLQVAADLMPDQVRVLLARLQIQYLRGDGPGYTATARMIAERFPGSASWADVARLGARLVPGEPLFAEAAATAAPGAGDAWPEALNWLESPQDSSGDEQAAAFRSRVLALPPYAEEQKWR